MSFFDLSEFESAPAETSEPAVAKKRPARQQPEAGSAVHAQDALFSEAEAEAIDKRIERWESDDHMITPAFSRAEKRTFGLFVDMMVWALTAPISCYRGNEDMAESIIARRGTGDVVLERLVGLMKLFRQMDAEMKDAQDQAQMQAVITKWVQRGRDQRERMTNFEVCLTFMGASLEAPLREWPTAEYMRAFAHVYGIDTFMELFKSDTSMAWQPLNANHCEMLRYADNQLYKRLPLLDREELEWIREFNSQVKARIEAKTAGLWSMVGKEAVVADPA